MDTVVVSGEIVGRRRRRSYSEELKRRMVAECAEPGASVSLVARKYDVNANLLFSWRRQFALRTPPPPALDLIPIGVVEEAPRAAPAAAERGGTMEIVLPNGARVRVDASVDERALRRVLVAVKAAG
jgi:transposase